ncbi:hypothetical protein SFRURICE_001124, partial [Spodoptera frugiperda]
VTSPMTNICPNTLHYLYDGHSWTEYASYFVTMFKFVSNGKFDARPIPFWPLCMPCSWTALLIQCLRINVSDHSRTRTIELLLDTLVPRRYIDTEVQLYGKRGVQNVTLVDFYMKSLVYTDGIGRASNFPFETNLNIVTK